jgi:acyl-CoA thioester hydrolase
MMPRASPALLDPAAYPHQDTIQTRFGDMDMLGHLNNVALAALFESARTRFNAAHRLWGPEFAEHRAVIARVEINYLAEGHYPADVEVATGIGRVGNRSWQVLALMIQGGRALATCDATLVMTKGADGEAVPDELRARMAQLAINGA